MKKNSLNKVNIIINFKKKFELQFKYHYQTVKTAAPPTALILLSAVFEKYLALMTTG
jgi:hypothetical protein